MLKRLFGSQAETRAAPDPLGAVERMLRAPAVDARAGAALKQACEEIGGATRGWIVRGSDASGWRVAAVHGYSAQLLELTPEHGPWRDAGPRLVGNLVQELFTPNDKPTRELLGGLGMREAGSSLVVPVPGPDRLLGAMLLHRHDSEPLRDEDLKRAARWAGVLGEALASAEELRRTRLALVQFTRAFVEAFEAQDFSQLGHGARVASYALALGRALELGRDELADLYFAAHLHDIGKMGSSDLSTEDVPHPARGANLVASSALLGGAAAGIRHHHENWDGTGFPDGLTRERIPRVARIVAVADAFDLLSSERGAALPMHEVEKALEARAGHELDPELVRVLVNILRQGRSTAELARVSDDDLPF